MPSFLEQRAAGIAKCATRLESTDAGVADGEPLGFDPLTILAVIGLIFQIVRCLRDRTSGETLADVRQPGLVLRWRVRSCAARVVGYRRAGHVARAILEDARTLSLNEWAQARADGLALVGNPGDDDV